MSGRLGANAWVGGYAAIMSLFVVVGGRCMLGWRDTTAMVWMLNNVIGSFPWCSYEFLQATAIIPSHDGTRAHYRSCPELHEAHSEHSV